MAPTLDLPGAQGVEHWFLLAGIDVDAPAGAAAIVTLGDSITDGRGVTHSGNNRWPDVLAERLQADPRTRNLAVLNHGVGGGPGAARRRRAERHGPLRARRARHARRALRAGPRRA